MTKWARRAERSIHAVFAVVMLAWLAGGVVLVAWPVIHAPVNLQGITE